MSVWEGKVLSFKGHCQFVHSFLVQAGGAFVWSIWTDIFIRWHGIDGLVSCCSHLSNLPLLLMKQLLPPPPCSGTDGCFYVYDLYKGERVLRVSCLLWGHLCVTCKALKLHCCLKHMTLVNSAPSSYPPLATRWS